MFVSGKEGRVICLSSRTNLDGDRFRPCGHLGRSGVVGHAYAESTIRAIADQLILARSLEAVEFTIEGAIVRVPENRADPVTWKTGEFRA